MKLFDGQIELTMKAFDRIVDVMKEENATVLRIGVKGGGCSGFMYTMDFVDTVDTEEDFVEPLRDDLFTFKIVVDELSMQYLKGITVDYINTLKESGFKFENPKPGVRTCGCGSSFSG